MGLSSHQPHRLYRGERAKDHVVITVHEAPGTYYALEDPIAGTHRADPDFEDYDWGRRTAGSERLAAALLRDALAGQVEPELAHALVDEVLVGLPVTDPWVLWGEDLQDWAREKGTQAAS